MWCDTHLSRRAWTARQGHAPCGDWSARVRLTALRVCADEHSARLALHSTKAGQSAPRDHVVSLKRRATGVENRRGSQRAIAFMRVLNSGSSLWSRAAGCRSGSNRKVDGNRRPGSRRGSGVHRKGFSILRCSTRARDPGSSPIAEDLCRAWPWTSTLLRESQHAL